MSKTKKLGESRMDMIGQNGNDGLAYDPLEKARSFMHAVDLETAARREREERAMKAIAEIHGKDDSRSDGSTASYYELPEGATELQQLISHRNMNAQLGEIFRAAYRYGMASHSDQLRDAKKIKFYIDAEIERLERLG